MSLYVSSIINPILYNLSSENYRKAFKKTFEIFFAKIRFKRAFSCCSNKPASFMDINDEDIVIIYF